MNKEQIIEEMAILARVFCQTIKDGGSCEKCAKCETYRMAERLYNAGYRKEIDVVTEVINMFKELTKKYLLDKDLYLVTYRNATEYAVNEITKKYKGE